MWVSVVASRAAKQLRKEMNRRKALLLFDITAFCLLLIDKIDVRVVTLLVSVAVVVAVVNADVVVTVCWLVSQ